jgi:hypothetical protein
MKKLFWLKHRFSAQAALLGILGVVVLVAQVPAQATEFTASGTVVLLRTFDSSVGVDEGGITLTGFASAGTCPLLGNRVHMRIRGDSAGSRQFAIALTGLALSRTVTVEVDDALKDSAGVCFLRFIRMD